MSRFTLPHPTRPELRCELGHDAHLGFFCETFIENRSKPMAILDMFTMGRAVTLNDVLDFLIDHEFFTRDILEEALAWIETTDEHESWRPGEGVMAVVRVVMGMKGQSA